MASKNVEQTCYAFLALHKAQQTSNAVPVVRYLLSHRNKNGGFSGTQDTVLGIEALAKFAQLISNADTNVDLVAKSDAEDTEKKFNVRKENALVLQGQTLPPGTRQLTLNASGRGFALFEVAYQYNIQEADAKPDFQLELEAKAENVEIFNLEIKTR